MSTKADYAPEEWQALYVAAPMVGLAVTSASPNGPFGVLKEMFSVGMALSETIEKKSPNALINALIDDIKARGTKPEQPQNLRSPEEAQKAALAKLEEVSAVLARKTTPEEAAEFKRWLLGIGQRVAEASNEGGFLGFGGVQVSDAEKGVLADIARALKLPG